MVRRVLGEHMLITAKTRGFTIVELMVVIAIIGILASLLITGVSKSIGAAKTAQSQNKLRSMHIWIQGWAGDHNDRVLPSQFDWNDEAEAGTMVQVKNEDFHGGDRHIGTWADILWASNSMYKEYGVDDRHATEVDVLRWKSSCPTADIYVNTPNFDNPFRSELPNSRNFYTGTDAAPKPFGPGAQQHKLQGFFAANDFFDARSDADGHPDGGNSNSTIDRYYTFGMLESPSKSLYLVDSAAGETISHKDDSGNDDESAWLFDFGDATLTVDGASGAVKNPTGEIDYRYGVKNGLCLILMLDGHVVQETPWSRLGLDNPILDTGGPDPSTLQGRGIRVGNLTKRVRSQ